MAALSALEAVARHGSVTAAARALHLSQSAVSHAIAALEQQLGVALVERAGRGVRLTARGALLARATGDALALIDEALRALAPRRTIARQALSISCSPSFAIRFLVPRLSSFRGAHPDVDLRIAAEDVPSEPGEASVDASVRLAAGPSARFGGERLIDEVVFPVVSPRLLEAGAPLACPDDLGRFTLLHDEALSYEPRRVGWAAWLRTVGATRVDAGQGMHFSHAYLAIEAALAGDGVALARRSLVAEDLVRGRLVAPLAESVPSGLAYWLALRGGSAEASPALVALRSFLIEALREAASAGDAARRHEPPPRARMRRGRSKR